MSDAPATDGQVQTIKSARSAVAIESERALLAQEWLDYFGADDPRELELGILMVIREWVADGLRPNLRQPR
jgi:hypothetical protein